MRKPKVLLDVDGVLADFLTPALGILGRLTGRSWRAEEITSWDLFEIVGKRWEEPFFETCAVPGFAAALEVCGGAKEAVAVLREISDLYVVTSPMHLSPTWTYEREEWIRSHFGIGGNRIVHTAAKYLCVGDVFVDDRPYNVQKWRYEHPSGLGILWDAPYNRLERGLPRTSDWSDVIQAVRNLPKKD